MGIQHGWATGGGGTTTVAAASARSEVRARLVFLATKVRVVAAGRMSVEEGKSRAQGELGRPPVTRQQNRTPLPKRILPGTPPRPANCKQAQIVRNYSSPISNGSL